MGLDSVAITCSSKIPLTERQFSSDRSIEPHWFTEPNPILGRNLEHVLVTFVQLGDLELQFTGRDVSGAYEFPADLTLVNLVANNGDTAVSDGRLPSQYDVILVDVDNSQVARGGWRGCNNDRIRHSPHIIQLCW